MNLADFLIAVLTNHDDVAFTNVFVYLVVVIVQKAALLSLSVFGDHELGVFITLARPWQCHQPGQLLPSVTQGTSAGNRLRYFWDDFYVWLEFNPLVRD